MELKTIEHVLRYITTALLLATLIQQIRWLHLLDLPVFCAYLALSFAQYVWSPHTITQALFIEPWVLSALVCSVIEAVSVCVGRQRAGERKWILTVMLCSGAFGMLALHGFLMGNSIVEAYRSTCQHVLVGLSVATVIGAVCYAMEGVFIAHGPRNHYLLMMAYLIAQTGIGFVHTVSGSVDPNEMTKYLEAHIALFTSTSVCLALWLKFGRVFRF